MPVSALFFDVDGTLLDSRELHIQGLSHAFLTVLQRIPAFDNFDTLFGRPFDELLEEILHRSSCADVVEHTLSTDKVLERLRREFMEFYNANAKNLIRVFDGIHPLLANLEARNCKLAIISSKRRRLCERELEAAGLLKYFPTRVFIEDVRRSKPAPDPVWRAMQLMAMEAATNNGRRHGLMVGDAIQDIECGKKAGLLSAHATWGRSSWAFAPDVGIGVTPDFVIDKPGDLLAIVDEN